MIGSYNTKKLNLTSGQPNHGSAKWRAAGKQVNYTDENGLK